jgi:DNA (cytosine-5)-methyltransferase 1
MQAISLFSGAGGMDVGFMPFFDVVRAYEWDASAVETYKINIGPHITHCDLSAVEIDDMPDAEIIFGGPPCQGFSQAWDGSGDTRNQLLWRFIEIIGEKRPRAFVMENVSALVRRKKWAGLREEILAAYEAMGYTVRALLLTASDHGVCQARERVFFVGFRDMPDDWNVDNLIKARLTKAQAPTVREVLEGLTEADQYTPNVAKITRAKNPILRGSPYKSDLLFNGRGRVLDLDSVARTIPASAAGNHAPIIDLEWLAGGSSWAQTYHDNLKAGGDTIEDVPPRFRRITAAEAAAFQSFPREYRFAGTKQHQFRQIGNAVPPKMARAVAQMVRDIVNEIDCAF